jgi:hypothetical protein
LLRRCSLARSVSSLLLVMQRFLWRPAQIGKSHERAAQGPARAEG